MVPLQELRGVHSQFYDEAKLKRFQRFTFARRPLAERAVSSFVDRMTFSKMKGATAAASLLLASFITTGCHTQLPHPDQLNTFDGASYDSMTLAHGALTSLRVSIAADFPRYTPEFNKAVEAYDTALAVYSAYRNSAAAEQPVSAALGNLAVSITNLESTLVADLHVDKQHSASVRKAAQQIRARANLHVTVADILTELEIAASLASLAPSTEAYAPLIKAIVNATETALLAEQTNAGKPIKLDSLTALALIE